MLTKPEGVVDDPLSEMWRLICLVVDCQRRRSEHSPTRSGKDMNGVPTSDCKVSPVRNTGWPTGGDPYGHRVLVVVGGVPPSKGDGEAVHRAEQDR